MLERDDYIVVDIEGTGRFGPENSIVEIACLRVVGPDVYEGKQWLVKPKCPITRNGTRIHGISNDVVEDCPTIQDVSSDIISFARNGIYVGHSIGADIDVISREIPEWRPVSKVDTLRMARRYFEDAPSHKMFDLISYIDAELEVMQLFRNVFESSPYEGSYHRAAYDVCACSVLYHRILALQNTDAQRDLLL